MEWDFFISHASEDKESFVEPLAKKLKAEGYRVWYDNFSLKAGDSIRRSIDKGISRSKYGLVILSQRFFQKEWPQKELDSLISMEAGDKCKVIPVWLEIGIEDIKKASPLLADKYAIKVTRNDINKVIIKVKELIKPRNRFTSDTNIDRAIKKITAANQFEQQYLMAFCLARFHQIVAYQKGLYKLDESDFKAIKKLETKYEIPEDIYISEGIENIKSSKINELVLLIKKWVKGRLKPVESYELYFLLDEYYDLDFLYVLFGIPNYIVSGRQHERLREAVFKIGCRRSGESFMSESKYMGYVYDKYFHAR